MSIVLEVIWVPEVETEYLTLLELNRDVGSDVGNQFGEFLRLAQRWNERDWKSIEPVGSAYL
jgi:hypothetical protein